jgi:hypothetical protein
VGGGGEKEWWWVNILIKTDYYIAIGLFSKSLQNFFPERRGKKQTRGLLLAWRCLKYYNINIFNRV